MIIYKDKQKKINIPQGLGNTKITVTQIMPDCPECPDIECPECDECPELENIKITKNGIYNGAFDRVEVKVEDSDGSYSAGYEDGFDEGFTDGFSDGYADGIADGVEQQKSLLQPLNITENGTYSTPDGYSVVQVSVPDTNGSFDEGYSDGYEVGKSDGITDGINQQKSLLQSLNVNKNGTYSTENGYSTVKVNVTGSRIEKIDVAESGLKFGSSTISEVPSYLDFSNVTDMGYMFNFCESLTTIPQLDTSNVIIMKYMFYNCISLTTLPPLDVSNVTDIKEHFGYYVIEKLTDVGGWINLKINWNDDYGLALCPNLTYGSCINILNGLADVTELGGRTLKVHFNFLKTVGDKISIGTSKGWRIIS